MEKAQEKFNLPGAVESNQLQLRVNKLADTINQEIYEQRKHLLGRVLTIIDASIPDPAQRKAAKDLANNEFYANSYWENIRDHFRWFAEAEGFKFTNYSEDVPSLDVQNPYLKIG